MAILALIPASDVAVALTNWLVTHLVGPRPLPRLELVGGVPSDLRTLVVVPTLLADEADIEAQVSLLEVQYLANAEGDLRFALLTDWLDAPNEGVPGDEALLGRGDRLHRSTECPVRRGPRGRGPLPALPPRTPLERSPGRLDGLGTQARQAPRAQRPAAWLAPTPPSWSRGDPRRCPRAAFATSSRSIPTLDCLGAPPHVLWARWRTR